MGIGWCVVVEPGEAEKIGGTVLGEIVAEEGVRVRVGGD